MKRLLHRAVGRVIDRWMDLTESRRMMIERTSPATKIALMHLFMHYRRLVEDGAKLPSVWDAGFRVFSQFDEDGITLFLLAAAGIGPRKFVDIGGGDGLWASNAANLALNFGFHGLFIDRDGESIERGERFYKSHLDTRLYPPKFKRATVTRSNINDLIRESGVEGEIDLLSIDIDGNDYWIWDAIDCINPRIVLMETHVEFGMNSVVVPYDEEYVWSKGNHPHYLGASPVAMTRLAGRLGYRLVGANRFGFNVFYLRNDLAKEIVPEIEVSELFKHDRNRERMAVFEEMKDFKFDYV